MPSRCCNCFGVQYASLRRCVSWTVVRFPLFDDLCSLWVRGDRVSSWFCLKVVVGNNFQSFDILVLYIKWFRYIFNVKTSECRIIDVQMWTQSRSQWLLPVCFTLSLRHGNTCALGSSRYIRGLSRNVTELTFTRLLRLASSASVCFEYITMEKS